MTLWWKPSTDVPGVAGYAVYRDGVQVGTTATTYYQDSGLTVETQYAYHVQAFDVAGNLSMPSPLLSARTLPNKLVH